MLDSFPEVHQASLHLTGEDVAVDAKVDSPPLISHHAATTFERAHVVAAVEAAASEAVGAWADTGKRPAPFFVCSVIIVP